MAELDNPYNQGGNGKKRNFNRRASRNHAGFEQDHVFENQSDETFKNRNHTKHQGASAPQTLFVSKQVDPETSKYFSEIANVIEGTDVEFEERVAICGNALEETRGKEVELATDYIISHTLQTLLDGCSVDHLCGFLRSCSKDFSRIAMDRSGSHVAETALKSLAMHLQDDESHSLVEETLTTICHEIVVNPVDVMCNCHGSHVLRSLLCLCKGVPLDTSEFHATKSSTVLAERLNFSQPQTDRNDSHRFQLGFPDLLKFVISEMINATRKNIDTLQVDQYSSLVLQTALKFLVGHEEELLHIIPMLLGCRAENAAEGHFIEHAAVKKLWSLMKETSFSHLMEVIIEVSPDTLYDELFTKVFQNSLFDMSSHPCGNFVIQALISHARFKSHMDLIWEELGTKFKDLLGMGKSVVIGCIVASSQKFHTHEHKCCQALAAAVTSGNESSKSIVPRILFLDDYFWSADKPNWNWPNGAKMNVVGSLILQSIFKIPSEFIQPFVSSITSIDEAHLLEALKDSRGARVIEAFLSSNVSGKQKRKLVVKLHGYFGDLAVHPSGSFTVDKCFSVSSVALREVIVSELLAVQTELSKTKQGPFLMRKLDVDGYAKRPDQWKLRQASKESAYNDFVATFGPKDTKSSKSDKFLSDSHTSLHSENLKEMRKDIDTRLASSGSQFLANAASTTLGKSSQKCPLDSSGHHTDKLNKQLKHNDNDDDVMKGKGSKKHKNRNVDTGTEKAVASEIADVIHKKKRSNPSDKKEKKRRKKDVSSQL